MYWTLTFRDPNTGEKFSTNLKDKKRSRDEVLVWKHQSLFEE